VADSIYSSGSRWVQRALSAVDAVLARALPASAAPPIAVPRRLLIANTGHLGDVLLATAVLPVLRRAFPDCRIGMLIGSWSRLILRDHPLVDAIHRFDHCRLNRSNGSIWQKLQRHDRTRRQALREIVRARYDVAIDLRHYFGNAIPLLWRAGIPVRIGYSSGGFGAMLTHPLRWRCADRHVVEYFADLLRVLPIGAENFAELRLTLGGDGALPRGLPHGPFVLLHMGTGAACKEWPLANWQELTRRLLASSHTVVLTGQGAKERRRCQRVALDSPRCVNVCDRLSWNEYVAVVRHARGVIAVDSLAGHVAAAVGTPCVVIGNGINHPAHWRPLGVSRVLLHPVPCAPCYRPSGCATMDCVRGISVDQVLDVLDEAICLRRTA
jgi:ADP-heptose:LPS heptosyltransferase